jgi:hypothetical protein
VAGARTRMVRWRRFGGALRLRRSCATALIVALFGPPAWGGGTEASPPPLTQEHVHPSGAFTFKTPADWQVQQSPTNPYAIEAGGGGLLVRFIFRREEVGYDSLHVDCMLERLASEMEQDPRIRYEYDFVSGVFGDRRGLDSAFVVTYNNPIAGYREWRQRNVTLVGAGQSLCAISYAPLPVWKKSRATRALLDGILASVTFR